MMAVGIGGAGETLHSDVTGPVTDVRLPRFSKFVVEHVLLSTIYNAPNIPRSPCIFLWVQEPLPH